MAEVVPLSDLTQSTLEGTGVFDVLMRSMKAHLEAEFQKGRIKGPEYATVYLGSLDTVMQTSLNFLVQRQRIALEAELMAQQVLVATAEVAKANAQVELVQVELLKANVEKDILLLTKDKVPAEIAHLEAQTALVGQQKLNLTAEGLNIPKQGVLLDAQADATTAEVALKNKQVEIATEEILISQQKVLLASREADIAEAKLVNIPKEGALLDAQAAVQNQQKLNLVSEELRVDAQTALTTQQVANAVIEGTVLTAQKCKLDAEYDHLLGQTLKVAGETSLLAQKTTTERAQTSAVGVDADSVIGKQKALYSAQTSGFTRDAEQKAAKLLVDTWNVRRTTDEGTVADATNKLSDIHVGRAVDKLLTGVGA